MSFPLHEAARDGKILTVKGLIKEDPKQVFTKDDDGRIPLHWAVAFSHLEIVSVLLNPSKFGDVKTEEIELDDYTDDSGWTVLHIASSVGNLDVLRLLLDNDPKPDLDLKTNTGLTSVHLATAKKHLDVVKELVKQGASVRIKDKKNQYPLHRAASVGSSGLVEFLVKEGKAPLNPKDINGWTPLHHALAEGFGDVGVLLVKLGADPNIEDSDGNTPFKVAVDEKVARYFKSELATQGLV